MSTRTKGKGTGVPGLLAPKTKGGQYRGKVKQPDGRWKEVRLGTDLSRAKVQYRQLRQQMEDVANGLQDPRLQLRPLREVVDAFLEDKARNVSEGHLRVLRDAVLPICEALGWVPPASISHERFTTAMELVRNAEPAKRSTRGDYSGQGLSRGTVNDKAARFRTMMRWAEAREYIKEVPVGVRTWQPFKVRKADRRHLRRKMTPQEQAQLVEGAHRYDLEAQVTHAQRIPQAPLIIFLLGTGLRFGEATRLTWGDIVTGENGVRHAVVTAESSKTDEARAVPLDAGVEEALAAAKAAQTKLAGRIPTKAANVFLGPLGTPYETGNNGARARKVLHRIQEAAGFPSVWPDGTVVDFHALRHSFCQSMMERGQPMQVTAALMGHADLRMIQQVYSESVRDAGVLEAAVHGLTSHLRMPATGS